MSTQLFDPAMTGARREYLDSLPVNFRSRAANIFLGPIRAAIRAGRTTTPGEAIRAIRSEVSRRLTTKRLTTDQRAGLEAMRESLSLDSAREYAAYLLGLESLPTAERATAKKQQDATGAANVPPTAAQLRYLRLLHYRGDAPETLGEAIALINRVKKGDK